MTKIEEIAQYTTSGRLPFSRSAVVHANGTLWARVMLETLFSFRLPGRRIMIRPILTVAALIVWLTPVFALDQPMIWRDPDTGCGYFLTPQGGMTIRFRADGRIDCPNASREAFGRGVLEDMARELGRGLDALRRELDRLRQRPEERI